MVTLEGIRMASFLCSAAPCWKVVAKTTQVSEDHRRMVQGTR